MNTREIDILELLPQRPSFVMVDTLTHYDPVVTCTELEVRRENLFFADGVLSEAGVVENIAQTCAARMGYINRYLRKEDVKIGFIGAMKNLVICRLPTVGEKIATRIEILSEVGNMTLVRAESHGSAGPVAACEMKIAILDGQ